jgi:hypothetical protein
VLSAKLWGRIALATGLAIVAGAQNSPSPFSATRAFAAPEAGSVIDGSYRNDYFALSYPIPRDWTQGLAGPPPSDTGYYVLRSIKPAATFKGPDKGTILLAAWDLFFVPRPAASVLELVKNISGNLPKIYTVDQSPSEVRIAGHSFAQLEYSAPAAQLHWKVLATELRCHMVEFVFTSADNGLLENLVRQMSGMKLPGEAQARAGSGGGEQAPPCVKGYASGSNVLHKVEPAMAGPRFSAAPTRVIIGADGKVKHIHVISASPDQAKSIQDAVAQWTFKPYMQNGVPTEVETGILFKFPPDGAKLPLAGEKY